MARIAEAELQHLKAAVPLVVVVQQQGRQLFKKGQDFTLLCPFHDEKTPSMVITPAKNLYHCFGCDAGGSVLDWVMHTEKLSRWSQRMNRNCSRKTRWAANCCFTGWWSSTTIRC